MKDKWTVETERMSVTLVSEKMPMPPGGHRSVPPGFDVPVVPTYLLITKPGGGDPIRVEAEDAELLMYLLTKLIGRRHHHGMHDVGMVMT